MLYVIFNTSPHDACIHLLIPKGMTNTSRLQERECCKVSSVFNVTCLVEYSSMGFQPELQDSSGTADVTRDLHLRHP